MARYPNNRVRGVRTPTPAGSLIGRPAGSGTGASQFVPMSQLALQLVGLGASIPGGSLPTIADGDVLANISGSTGYPVGDSLSAVLDHVFGSAQGDILYRDSSVWKVLAPGTSGYFLKTQGASANPVWAAGGSGLITAVDSNFTVASGTLELATIASGDLIANSGSSTAEPTATTMTAMLDRALGSTEGQILQRGASAWQVLAPGTAGQVLTSGGASALNAWAAAGGSYNARGAWSGTTAYNPGDVVTYNGSAYLCYTAIAAPTGFTSFNPADTGAGVVLSNGNLTATAAAPAADEITRVVDVKTTGKYYFEFFGHHGSGGTGDDTGMGVATSAATGPGMGGNGTLACCMFGSGYVWLNGAHASGSPNIGAVAIGDIVACAVDIGAGLAWFKDITTGSNWNGSGTANPATGTGGVNMAVLGGSLYIAATLTSGSTTDYWTLNAGSSSFTGSVPSGFAGWSGGSSNTAPAGDDVHWLSQGVITAVDSNFTVASGTLELATIASGDVIGNSGASTAEPGAATMTAMLDRALGSTEGQILQRGSSVWQVLAPGTSGQALVSGGASALNAWGIPTWTGAPGGRLSLSSGVAVQIADVSAGTTVYYVPYIHNRLPVVGLNIGAGVSLALDSNSGHTGYQQSGKLFDLFLYNSSGTLLLGTGPAWTSSTARSAAIDQITVAGTWTNTATMTLKTDATSATISAAAGSALYVGTMYASANGQCTVQFNPAAASGGANTTIGLYNAYKREFRAAQSVDSTADWTYDTNTWRSANNSNSNRVTFVDGLGNISSTGQYLCNAVSGTTASDFPELGVNFNSTSATPKVAVFITSFFSGDGGTAISAFPPALGLNFIQAMENINDPTGTAGTFASSGKTQMLSVQLEF